MAAPLFLLAPPRSYTSLVNAMIGQHPQAFGLPELCLFNVGKLIDLWNGVEGENAERGAMARHGLMRAVAEIYCGEQSTATVNMAHAWAGLREDWDTGRVFRELVDELDPLVAVEKSPSYTVTVQRMQALYETFPEARFIHLVRHPIAQGKSVMAINNGAFTMRMGAFEIHEEYALLEPQIAWHDVNVNILEFLDQVPASQQIRVRGEDIMGDPQTTLAEISRWLGLRDDPEAVEEMMHPERSPFACFGPLAAMFGNDPNFLAGPTFKPHKPKIPALDASLPWRTDGQKLYPQVVAMAREFGYE
jgi:Sulfotransferase family